MKRLLLLVSVSLLLAMWIHSTWESAQATAPAPARTVRTATIRLTNIEGNHRITGRSDRSQFEFDGSRLTFDQNERHAAGAPILADPLELRRTLR
jgi:hypothetical protein